VTDAGCLCASAAACAETGAPYGAGDRTRPMLLALLALLALLVRSSRQGWAGVLGQPHRPLPQRGS